MRVTSSIYILIKVLSIATLINLNYLLIATAAPSPQNPTNMPSNVLTVTPKTVQELEKLFNDLNYTWPLKPNSKIPAIELTQLPSDMATVRNVQKKKSLFIRSLLPLILLENQRIRQQFSQPTQDELPASLVVAQAAIESGWGTSRFAREGNSLFGQWTYQTGKGIIPKQRTAGKTHQVRAFDTLRHSVRAYLQNINQHKAYRELRLSRAEMRGANQSLQAKKLATHLHRYSQKGMKYVTIVKQLLNSSSFTYLDQVNLNTLNPLTIN